MFFRRQRSEGIEGLDRIRESLRQQQRERSERGDVDDLLITDPAELEESVEIITPVRESQQGAEPEAGKQESAAPAEPAVLEATPFVETPAPSVSAPAPAAPVPEPAPPPAEPFLPTTPVAPSEQAADRFRRPEPARVTSGESLIARNASWDGQLYAEGDIRIEGALQGAIEAHETVFIAQDARVKAKVRARNIVIAGEFDGEIICEEKLEVLPTGSIAGQVSASTLVIHEGAFVDSRFAMNLEGAAGRSRSTH